VVLDGQVVRLAGGHAVAGRTHVVGCVGTREESAAATMPSPACARGWAALAPERRVQQ
jgi:hypothetical protein